MNTAVPTNKARVLPKIQFGLIIFFGLMTFVIGLILGPQVQSVFAKNDPLACPTPPAPFTLVQNVIIETESGSQYLLCGWAGGVQSPLP